MNLPPFKLERFFAKYEFNTEYLLCSSDCEAMSVAELLALEEGASQKFQEVIADLNQQPKVLILRMRHVPFIDATAVNRLRELCTQLLAKGTFVIISGANREVKKELLQAGLYQLVGKNNVHSNIREALQHAEGILGEGPTQA